MAIRHEKDLASFVAYCKAHPEERFWQALRNWCGWHFVYVSDKVSYEININEHLVTDTFYKEKAQREISS
jgi:hypothetical protein